MLLLTGCQVLRRNSRLKNKKQEVISYTVEREFLSKITVTEFVNHIIQSHGKTPQKRGGFTMNNASENPLL